MLSANIKPQGVAHLAGAQVICQLLQWAAFFLLARLLTPHEFGTAAAALIVLDLVLVLTDLGLGAALIQRQDLRDEHVQTAFWLNLALGGALAAAILLAASPIARLFGNPALGPLLLALPLAFVAASAGMVPQALIEREMAFHRVARIMAVSQAAYAMGAMSAALAGAGAWSVVVGMAAWHLTRLLLLLRASSWRPKPVFSLPALREISPYGLQLLGASLVDYGTRSLDVALIGSLLGPTALGIYSLAYRLITWPLMRISTVVTKVAFPAFSRLQGDQAALQQAYLGLIRLLAALTFPLLAGLSALAPEVIPWLFGQEWRAAVVPTQALCVVGMIKAVSTTDGTILYSIRRAGLEVALNVSSAFLLVGYLIVGAPYGLHGVVLTMTGAGIVVFPIYRALVYRQIGLSARRYWAALGPALGASALLYGCLQIYRWLIGSGTATLPYLLGAALIGLSIYLPLIAVSGVPVKAWLKRVRTG